MDALLIFIRSNKGIFEAAQALSAVVSLVGWCVGGVLLFIAWRRNAIRSVSVGPISFQMEAAVEAAAVAARDWQAKTEHGAAVDVGRIRATVSQAFDPATADKLIGKSVLWVDDNPANNTLAVRALRRLQLDIEQVTSTELALEALKRRHFDLIISDMGRGTNMRAGYELLKAVRDQGNDVPFFIFAGSDKPEFRREAAERGAQLSTNDMLELIDHVIKHLKN
jgi:CheY-like chemotaxis protein